MYKKRTISLIASSILLGVVLTGCGSDSSTTDAGSGGGSGSQNTSSGTQTATTITPQTTITGSAVDGYLRYSTVCLDLDNNGYCQPSEPYGLTDDNGSFSLALTSLHKAHENIQTAQLLVYGGQDSDTAEDFIGKLKSPNDGNGTINVTPLTTLVAAFVSDVSSTGTQVEKIEAAKAKVATVLGLTKEQVSSDPVALAKGGNGDVLSKALQVQKAVEKIVEVAKEGQNTNAKADASFEIFTKLAKSLDTKTVATDVTAIVEGAKGDIQIALDVNATTMESMISNAKNLATAVDTVFKSETGAIDATKISEFSSVVATVKAQETISATAGVGGNLATLKTNSQIESVKRILLGLGVSESGLSVYTNLLSNLATLINPTMTLEQMKTALGSNSSYSSLVTLIDTKIAEKTEARETVAQQQTDATNAAKPFIAITVPFTMYKVDAWIDWYNGKERDAYKIEQNDFTTGNTITWSRLDYDYDKKEFVSFFDDEKNYQLSNGSWIEVNNAFTKQSDNSVAIFDGKFGINESKDIAGNYTANLDDKISLPVTMPVGAKAYMAKFETTTDNFEIHEPQRNWHDSQNNNVSYYTTLKSVIEGQCGTHWFMGDGDGGYAFGATLSSTSNSSYPSYTCNGNATSGKLFEVQSGGKVINTNAGTWEIKTIQGKQILIATPYDGQQYDEESAIYTVANPDSTGDKVWRGWHDKKGEIHTWTTYNETAMNAIKETIKSNTFASIFLPGNSLYYVGKDDFGHESQTGYNVAKMKFESNGVMVWSEIGTIDSGKDYDTTYTISNNVLSIIAEKKQLTYKTLHQDYIIATDSDIDDSDHDVYLFFDREKALSFKTQKNSN